MKLTYLPYQQVMNWVQVDMNKDRVIVNRKVFSVVLWCLIYPVVLASCVYWLRKNQILGPFRYLDTLMFLPPFVYALYSLWPTLRDLPRVFRKGGLGAMLDASSKEVEWSEKTADKLNREIQLTPKEWQLVSFHLEQEMVRLQDQNRYMTILSAVVLFFMFQFLDLGGSTASPVEASPTGMIKLWVDQLSQWGIQIFALTVSSTLFYLSGLQFHRYLQRYWVCIKRISYHAQQE